MTFAALGTYLKYPNYEKIKVIEEELSDSGNTPTENFIEKSKHGVFYSEEDYFFRVVSECGLVVGNRVIRHPLCYLMEAADSIAYLCMDMEDGFNKDLFNISHVCYKFKENESHVAQEIVKICEDEFITQQ